MAKRPVGRKQSKRKAQGEGKLLTLLGYYQRPFDLLHQDLQHSTPLRDVPSSTRYSFWKLVPAGQYANSEAQNLLNSYLLTLEREMKSRISLCSVIYWLHLCRRIFPGSIGRDKSPMTRLLLRSTMEAGFQRYGRLDQCGSVAFSNQVEEGQILDGLLMCPEFECERRSVRENPQLVLTKFNTKSLHGYYEIEKLAYEKYGVLVLCFARWAREPLWLWITVKRWFGTTVQMSWQLYFRVTMNAVSILEAWAAL